MKKHFYFISVLALAMLSLSSCSDTHDEPANGNEVYDGANASYFSFSIASGSGTGSRADYVDGEGDEAVVDNVVLFFYDNKGEALNVNMGTTNTNYYIISKPGLNPDDEPNVENWFEQTIKLKAKSNIDNAKVLTVVNANVSDGKVCNFENTPISGNLSMATLRGTIFRGFYQSEKFVMSTSVYQEDGGSLHDADEVKIYPTEDAAKEGKAIIYVERVQARVKITEKAGTTNNIFDIEDKEGLKLKVTGVTLNTTAVNAYLFKHLDNPGGNWTWNDDKLHRSYWETTPSENTYETAFTPSEINDTKFPLTSYINPNTSSTPTLALVVGELQKDGEPYTVATWYGNEYAVDALPAAVLNSLGDVATKYYTKNGETYTSLDADDIVLTQGSGNASNSESWLTYFSLKKGDNVVYYEKTSSGIGDSGTQYVTVSAEVVEQALGLGSLEGAKVWNKTYYFAEIDHLGGKTGVVRNHAYELVIDGFKGLGTPIYNPDQEIPVPERPEDDVESWVSVKMNVLSWRIVPKQTITFE